MRGKSAVLVVVLLAAGCGGEKAAAPPPSPTTTVESSSSAPPSPTSSAPPVPADGTNLAACVDGTCEVEIKAGDVITFGPQVKSTPELTSLTVVAMSAGGPTLAMSSGMTTTAYGSISMNNAVSFETIWSDGTRAMARISLINQ